MQHVTRHESKAIVLKVSMDNITTYQSCRKTPEWNGIILVKNYQIDNF